MVEVVAAEEEVEVEANTTKINMVVDEGQFLMIKNHPLDLVAIMVVSMKI